MAIREQSIIQASFRVGGNQRVHPTVDPTVNKYVSNHPKSVYRKANLLGDLLMHSDIQWKPPVRHRNIGMHRCGIM